MQILQFQPFILLNMRSKWKFFVKIFSFLSLTFFYCEFLNYYIVISQCSWPEFPGNINDSVYNSQIKAMFIADTHLLGPFRGHWLDKLRREWQMYRAFQSAITLYNPEIVFILGDLFDEGQWCNKAQLLKYFDRFSSLFKVPSSTEIQIVPGNHDVGFHYAIRPYHLHYFEELFNISNVQFLNIKENYFILINSMAMEGDGCNFCFRAEKKLKNIAAKLKCFKDKKKCGKKMEFKKYSQPIIIQHFPMYRMSDSVCKENDEAPAKIKNEMFHEKWDCLSQRASEMIFDELEPRLIFNGHTHHGCHIIHRKNIHEYTLSSFNWRNKNNPAFILAKITPTNHTIQKCYLPKETTVILIYSCAVLGVIVCITLRLLKKKKTNKFI